MIIKKPELHTLQIMGVAKKIETFKMPLNQDKEVSITKKLIDWFVNCPEIVILGSRKTVIGVTGEQYILAIHPMRQLSQPKSEIYVAKILKFGNIHDQVDFLFEKEKAGLISKFGLNDLKTMLGGKTLTGYKKELDVLKGSRVDKQKIALKATLQTYLMSLTEPLLGISMAKFAQNELETRNLFVDRCGAWKKPNSYIVVDGRNQLNVLDPGQVLAIQNEVWTWGMDFVESQYAKYLARKEFHEECSSESIADRLKVILNEHYKDGIIDQAGLDKISAIANECQSVTPIEQFQEIFRTVRNPYDVEYRESVEDEGEEGDEEGDEEVPGTFWERNKGWIIAGLIIVGISASALVLWLIARSRREKVEEITVETPPQVPAKAPETPPQVPAKAPEKPPKKPPKGDKE